MEDDFDYEIFLNDGLPVEPLPKIFEEIDYDDESFTKELAFHEASHFVFDIIGEKMNLGFSEIVAIEIDPQGIKSGSVTGFSSPYPGKSDYDFASALKRKQWYLEDDNRLRVRLLSVLAGYTSYQVFMRNIIYFINPTIENKTALKIKYYRIDSMPTPKPKDFNMLDEMLGWINQKSLSKLIEIQAIIKQVMVNQSVFTAIGFVKNYLIKNVGRKISGTELKELIRKTRKQVKRVSFKPYLDFL